MQLTSTRQTGRATDRVIRVRPPSVKVFPRADADAISAPHLSINCEFLRASTSQPPLLFGLR